MTREMQFFVRFGDLEEGTGRSHSKQASAALAEIADAAEEIVKKHGLEYLGIGYGIPRGVA